MKDSTAAETELELLGHVNDCLGELFQELQRQSYPALNRDPLIHSRRVIHEAATTMLGRGIRYLRAGITSGK